MNKNMLNKIEEEIYNYAREEWEDFSYSINDNGIITESYSGDGEYGHISIATGASVAITATDDELLKFFHGDVKFVEIIKDVMAGKYDECEYDEYIKLVDDEW